VRLSAHFNSPMCGGSCSNWHLAQKLTAGHSKCSSAKYVCCDMWKTQITRCSR